MTGYQKKTIKKVLRAKLIDWINSIEDNNIKKLVIDNAIVTGRKYCFYGSW